MTVAESTVLAVDVEFASNFAASGDSVNLDAVTVPDGSLLVMLAGSISSLVTDLAITDVDSHTWTELLPYDGSFGVLVAYWLNDTGSSVSVTPVFTPTWTSNKSIAVAGYLIAGSDGSPSIVDTITNADTAQASATPSVSGSLFCLHYANSSPTADVSSFATGSTADSSPAGTGVGNTGSNEFGIGTIYQTAVNAQTSTPVTVGAAAPTSAESYAVLVEYKPAGGGGSTDGTLTGVVATAELAAVPGSFPALIEPVVIATALDAFISYASNFGASGSPSPNSPVDVPDGSMLILIAGANSSSVTDIVNGDADSHTWTHLTVYDPDDMPLAVAYWFNDTGSTVTVTSSQTPTWAFNKTIGEVSVLVSGSNGTPVVVGTLTGATTTPELSGTPSADGSVMALHYVQQQPAANLSAFIDGSTGDTLPVGYAVGNTGFDEMGLGTVYQSSVNDQTADPVTVGAAAPSATTYAVLVEYVPASVTPPVGDDGVLTGAVATATVTAIAGEFGGITSATLTGAVATAVATAKAGIFEASVVITGEPPTITTTAIAGTFGGQMSGTLTGAVATATIAAIPGLLAGEVDAVFIGAVATAVVAAIAGVITNERTHTALIVGAITGPNISAIPTGAAVVKPPAVTGAELAVSATGPDTYITVTGVGT